jgi:hypothetical protein
VDFHVLEFYVRDLSHSANPLTVGATSSVIITALVVSPTFPTSILYALHVGA